MRGLVDGQTAMWCSVSTEDLVPADHPIRRIKPIVDAILVRLEPTFNGHVLGCRPAQHPAGASVEGVGADGHVLAAQRTPVLRAAAL